MGRRRFDLATLSSGFLGKVRDLIHHIMSKRWLILMSMGFFIATTSVWVLCDAPRAYIHLQMRALKSIQIYKKMMQRFSSDARLRTRGRLREIARAPDAQPLTRER